MMLGHPERVEAALVHALGVGDHLVQRIAQLRFRIAAVVDRRAGIAEILHVGGAVIGAVEFCDHRSLGVMSCSGLTFTPPPLAWHRRFASSSTPAEPPWRTVSGCARRAHRGYRQSGTRC